MRKEGESSGDIPTSKIQPMVSGRDNKSVRSTKGEIANQKWPNPRYKTFAHLSAIYFSPLLMASR
jgi:hypothetical protein